MYRLIAVRTQLVGECTTPAQVKTEDHESYPKAFAALRSRFAEAVAELAGKMDYCFLTMDRGSARISGGNKIIVLEVRPTQEGTGGLA